MADLTRSRSVRGRRRAFLFVLSFVSSMTLSSSWSSGMMIAGRGPSQRVRHRHRRGGRVVGGCPASASCWTELALSARRKKGRGESDESLNYWESDDDPTRRRKSSTAPPSHDDDYQYDDRDSFFDLNDRDDDDVEVEEDALEWEACPTDDAGTAHVLLPPSSLTPSSASSERSRLKRRPPTCIIHFVGGTFFGSSPTVWYGQLLRDVVRHSSAAVVASSIPVTVLQSPLQHVQLARKVTRQFEAAYRDVLVDEYGEDALRSVPVCALGHSLGSRLLVVAATLPSPKIGKSGRRTGGTVVSPPPYRSYILMSFTNFGAAAGIPGVGTLYKARRQVDRQQQEDDGMGGGMGRQQLRPRDRRKRRGRNGDEFDRISDDDEFGDDDDDDDDDDDGVSLWEDLTSVVKESARWIQSSLTPDASSLEFYPTPAQLWKALRPQSDEDASASGGGRYRVPQTLLVQFDQDRVDQSAKLAATIRSCSDVRFARLRGTHLAPLAPNPQSPGALLSLARGRRMSQKSGDPTTEAIIEQSTLSDLRQTIVRYATEVVTKGVRDSTE